MIRLEIMVKPASEFFKGAMVAIHAMEPSYADLLDLIQEAFKDNYSMIVIYTSAEQLVTNSGIKESVINKLQKDFVGEADVYADEVNDGLGDGLVLNFYNTENFDEAV